MKSLQTRWWPRLNKKEVSRQHDAVLQGSYGGTMSLWKKTMPSGNVGSGHVPRQPCAGFLCELPWSALIMLQGSSVTVLTLDWVKIKRELQKRSGVSYCEELLAAQKNNNLFHPIFFLAPRAWPHASAGQLHHNWKQPGHRDQPIQLPHWREYSV